VERFADKFDYIENVQFMGGEPSMNPRAIQRAGEMFKKLVGQGSLLGEPNYTTVTNGLRFTRNFLSIVKAYDVQLTVSLDGPKEVNDAVRIRKNGKGSYDAIRNSINEAISIGIACAFEPTFSKRHLELGMNLIDLCQWFFDEFGVSVLHAPPMSENRYGTEDLALSNVEKIKQYCAVTEWGVDNLLERGQYLMHGFTARLLESFESKRRNTNFCPAGNTQLSVSTTGDVSPCWMFTDEAGFDMGNVREDFLGSQGQNVLNNLLQNELHSHPECRVCMIQPVCFGCKGGDYHTTGTIDEKTNCDYMRACVATFVMRMFSRPTVPSTSAEYLSRESFGEQILDSLRPKGNFKPIKSNFISINSIPVAPTS
jgi:uncharacterized protein